MITHQERLWHHRYDLPAEDAITLLGRWHQRPVAYPASDWLRPLDVLSVAVDASPKWPALQHIKEPRIDYDFFAETIESVAKEF